MNPHAFSGIHFVLLEHCPTDAILELHIAADSIYFSGHFPQQPIFPGVAQINVAITKAKELFLLPIDFLGLEHLKFKQVILPNTPLKLRLEWNLARSHLNFEYYHDEQSFASGRILFKS